MYTPKNRKRTRKYNAGYADLVNTGAALRRRDSHWRVTSKLNVILLVGVLASFGVLSLVLPKPTVSEYENRSLQEMPHFSLQGLVSGKYIEELELYYSDSFPLRENFVRAAANIQEDFGVDLGGRLHTAPDPVHQDETPSPAPSRPEPQDSAVPVENGYETPAEETPEIPTVADDGAMGEQYGSVFIYKGQALPLFSPSEQNSRRYAQAINDYHAALGDSAQIYNLIVPAHIEFALPERLQDITSPEKPNIDFIYSLLEPGIKPVDAYTNLLLHNDEYLYFATDHHWTGLGAYYAYQAFCEQAGFEPVPLESMEKRTLENFIGSLYTQTQNSSLLKNPDHVDYWIIPTPHKVEQYLRGSPYQGRETTLLGEYAKSPNSYSVFLQGDYPLTKITTNIKNGRKIAVVKESFGNAFSPFLVNHYEEVYVVDQRYFQLNLVDYMKEHGINELLFINNIFAANTAVRISEIERLRTQTFLPYNPPAPKEEASSQESSSEGGEDEEKASSSSKPEKRSGGYDRDYWEKKRDD
ncbi:MAG: hypothetical protein DBX66_05465 [Clostridiales bacterium]|uniref:DHHW motif protein n=1 Tax=Harryflintia acetispora TaxID=1849041 RepID=A0A9X8Y977_9FIRM|nr:MULTISPECIES: DHHW family protein [Oscillospiraceae]PWM37350.1 MAG: hypothetical protein DBX66_05465 [Clostridiales bacterium]RGB68917.1 hypothetical protein DW086_04120 [Harryflintia acetispora]TCL45246.1 DHHW motif protein [Harryflintia acetispora]